MSDFIAEYELAVLVRSIGLSGSSALFYIHALARPDGWAVPLILCGAAGCVHPSIALLVASFQWGLISTTSDLQLTLLPPLSYR
jgi:hypothetical protein